LNLFLLRHGDAGKRVLSGASIDAALTETAKKDIVAIARAMKALDLEICKILTSPLRRSVQTARTLGRVLEMEDKILVCTELAPEGSRIQLSGRLHQYPPDSSIVIVGHEPYLSNMLHEIVFHEKSKVVPKRSSSISKKVPGTQTSSGITLKKAGLAKVRLTSLMPKMQGELRWLMTPRILKRLQGTIERTSK
jgi:phosphohistidine phosphatase